MPKAGRPVEAPGWRASNWREHPAQAEADHARPLAEQEMARQAVSGAPLDATFIDPDGAEISLRLVFNHVIAEYARHNGHADLLRQCVDGVTGA